MLVSDIQGVQTTLTDPQIHSEDTAFRFSALGIGFRMLRLRVPNVEVRDRELLAGAVGRSFRLVRVQYPKIIRDLQYQT